MQTDYCLGITLQRIMCPTHNRLCGLIGVLDQCPSPAPLWSFSATVAVYKCCSSVHHIGCMTELNV